MQVVVLVGSFLFLGSLTPSSCSHYEAWNVFDVFYAIGGASWNDFDKASVPASKGGASYSKRPRQELAAR